MVQVIVSVPGITSKGYAEFRGNRISARNHTDSYYTKQLWVWVYTDGSAQNGVKLVEPISKYVSLKKAKKAYIS